jgi:hypothetical protein
VFNQKKRSGASASHCLQSQADADSDREADGAAENCASRADAVSAVLLDLRHRLRARSKDILVMIRLAALNILSPGHVQALLSTVSTIPGA